MRIETAPPEWLRAIVETVCATLEINPAMLPADPHLAGEKVGEAIKEAVDDATEGFDDYDLGATAADGIPDRAAESSARKKSRDALAHLAAKLHTLLGNIHELDYIAENTADAVNDEIAHIEETLKEKK
jgi:hypothetical protein